MPTRPRESTKSRGSPTATSDRKSTRLNSSHTVISYAVFCLKKKKKKKEDARRVHKRGKEIRAVDHSVKGVRQILTGNTTDIAREHSREQVHKLEFIVRKLIP